MLFLVLTLCKAHTKRFQAGLAPCLLIQVGNVLALKCVNVRVLGLVLSYLSVLIFVILVQPENGPIVRQL